MNEQSCIAKVLKGDIEAFQPLVEAYQERIYAFILKNVGHIQDAEELTQEVFLKAFRALSSFEQRSSFATWLYRIALNTCRDHLIKRRPVPTGDKELSLALGAGPGPFQAPGPQSPENYSEEQEFLHTIHQGVKSLPPEQRAVLVLRLFEDKNYKQISEILDCSTQTARVRYFRARQTLIQFIVSQRRLENALSN